MFQDKYWRNLKYNRGENQTVSASFLSQELDSRYKRVINHELEVGKLLDTTMKTLLENQEDTGDTTKRISSQRYSRKLLKTIPLRLSGIETNTKDVNTMLSSIEVEDLHPHLPKNTTDEQKTLLNRILMHDRNIKKEKRLILNYGVKLNGLNYKF